MAKRVGMPAAVVYPLPKAKEPEPVEEPVMECGQEGCSIPVTEPEPEAEPEPEKKTKKKA